MSKMNRRAFLARTAVAVPAVLSSAPAAANAVHPDAELFALGHTFERLVAELDTIPVDDEAGDEKTGEALDLIEAMNAIRAQTIDGMLVKARACLWAAGSMAQLHELVSVCTSDTSPGMSLVLDVLAMSGVDVGERAPPEDDTDEAPVSRIFTGPGVYDLPGANGQTWRYFVEQGAGTVHHDCLKPSDEYLTMLRMDDYALPPTVCRLDAFDRMSPVRVGGVPANFVPRIRDDGHLSFVQAQERA